MTQKDLREYLGIKGIRTVSENTKVVETTNGNCYPATELVQKMWKLLSGEE